MSIILESGNSPYALLCMSPIELLLFIICKYKENTLETFSLCNFSVKDSYWPDKQHQYA